MAKRTPGSSTGKKSAQARVSAVRSATSKVKAKAAINFSRSVRGK